jgi:hypothetical protein
MNADLSKRCSVAQRAALAVLLAVILKLVAHWLGCEFISLNPLFSGIVAANVFLMSFLLSGVLADYKESERLPGELACSLEAIADEAFALYSSKQAAPAGECLRTTLDLSEAIVRWFHKKERTEVLMKSLYALSRRLAALEPFTQATFVARLKQEQGNLRRIITRIHTIRETSFVASGYLLANATTACVVMGLVFARIDPFYESLFFVGVITFLLVFLGMLIRDLDNPFGHYEQTSAEDVSLKPLTDAVERIRLLTGDAVPGTDPPGTLHLACSTRDALCAQGQQDGPLGQVRP